MSVMTTRKPWRSATDIFNVCMPTHEHIHSFIHECSFKTQTLTAKIIQFTFSRQTMACCIRSTNFFFHSVYSVGDRKLVAIGLTFSYAQHIIKWLCRQSLFCHVY